MRLIKFEDFYQDFVKKVEFKGGGHDFTELTKGIWSYFSIGDKHHEEIYGLDKSGETNDYFYYMNERFCVSGNAIVSYQRNSYLKKVQGFIEPAALEEIKETVIVALDSYKKIQKLGQNELVNVDISYPYEKAIAIARVIYRKYCKLFETSIEHTLSGGCAYSPPEFDRFVKHDVYRYGADVDWSFEQFTEYFNTSKIMDFLFYDYNPQAIADTYNKYHAKKLAWVFHDSTKLKSGIRLKETWRYLGSWEDAEDGYLAKDYFKCRSVELLEALKVCFGFCEEQKLVGVLDKILSSKLAMGDSLQDCGIAVRVYKEHYVVTLDKKALDHVLLYVNKYAQSDFKDALERLAA